MAPAIAPQVTQLWILIASSYKRTLLWVSQIMSCLTTINTFIRRRLKELWLHKYTITAIFQFNNNNVTRRTLCNYFPHILLFISDCPALDHCIEKEILQLIRIEQINNTQFSSYASPDHYFFFWWPCFPFQYTATLSSQCLRLLLHAFTFNWTSEYKARASYAHYSNDIMQLCVDQINSLSLSRRVLRASHN